MHCYRTGLSWGLSWGHTHWKPSSNGGVLWLPIKCIGILPLGLWAQLPGLGVLINGLKGDAL